MAAATCKLMSNFDLMTVGAKCQVVVRANSHEAAAALFENHPHFTIFPGEAVQVMPVLPIPGI